jgi:hypothetical protein
MLCRYQVIPNVTLRSLSGSAGAQYCALQSASFSRYFKPDAGKFVELRVMDFKEL